MEIFASKSSRSRLKDVLARAIHEEYVRNQTARGETKETNSTLVDWEELPDHLRESNRSQALHIVEKLKAIGCDVTELDDGDVAGFEFTPQEIERLARMEHERWVEERLANGWTVGPKGIDRKTHPLLCASYEELPEEEREKDRDAVRRTPKILAKVGLKIRRPG